MLSSAHADSSSIERANVGCGGGQSSRITLGSRPRPASLAKSAGTSSCPCPAARPSTTNPLLCGGRNTQKSLRWTFTTCGPSRSSRQSTLWTQPMEFAVSRQTPRESLPTASKIVGEWPRRSGHGSRWPASRGRGSRGRHHFSQHCNHLVRRSDAGDRGIQHEVRRRIGEPSCDASAKPP